MPSVIGLDCSLSCTGIAVVYDDRGTKTRTVKTASSDRLDLRVSYIYEAVAGTLLEDAPVHAFIERPFEHGKGPSAWKNGLPIAAALLALHDCDTRYTLIAPKQRAKYATGKGNASKDEVLAAAIRKFGYQGSSNDEADALVIAYLGLELLPEGVGFDPYDGWPSVTKPALELVESMKLADAATP